MQTRTFSLKERLGCFRFMGTKTRISHASTAAVALVLAVFLGSAPFGSQAQDRPGLCSSPNLSPAKQRICDTPALVKLLDELQETEKTAVRKVRNLDNAPANLERIAQEVNDFLNEPDKVCPDASEVCLWTTFRNTINLVDGLANNIVVQDSQQKNSVAIIEGRQRAEEKRKLELEQAERKQASDRLKELKRVEKKNADDKVTAVVFPLLIIGVGGYFAYRQYKKWSIVVPEMVAKIKSNSSDFPTHEGSSMVIAKVGNWFTQNRTMAVGLVVGVLLIGAWYGGSRGGGSESMPSVCIGKGPHPYTSVDGAKSGSYRINLYSKDGQALAQLVSRGNYTVTGYYNDGGYCFGDIHVQGQANGNSYNVMIYSQLF